MVTTPVFEHLFNIGQGLKSFDTSGNHRHSVLSGNPSWVAGRKGKAIALDGTDDAFVAPIPECDDADFTVGFWVQNWLDAGATGAGILALQSASDIHVTNNCVIIYRDVGTDEIKVVSYDSAYALTILSSGSTANSGFMCIRRSGDTLSFFLNGAFVAEASVTEIRACTWLLVGQTSYGYATADWIDKIRYWDSALSDEEIEYWYAKDKPRWNDSCVLWLRGDEENGLVVKDYSPHGNNGALTASLNDGANTGDIWAVEAEKGVCFELDGTVKYVEFSEITLTGEFTCTCWVKRTSISKHMFIFGGSVFATKIGFYSGSNGCFIRLNGTTCSSSPVPFDEWFFFCLRRNASNEVFLNVNNDASVKISSTATGDIVFKRIGADESSNYGVGFLKDARVYNRYISDDEVSALYNRTSEVSYGCVGKWLLNEGSGTTAYDSHNRFTAKRGNGLNFVSGELIAVSGGILQNLDAVTCCVWFEANHQIDSFSPFLNYEWYTNSFMFNYRSDDVVTFYTSDAVNTQKYAAKSLTPDNLLHYAVGLWQSGLRHELYLDGELANEVAAPSTFIPKNATLYIAFAGSGSQFLGLIDEFIVFSRALTATEIKRVYEADGFLDYIPLRIQDGSLVVSVDSVGVQWDSWANGACRRKHLGLGKNVAYTFTVLEETADVPWIDSAAYILKEKKDSGTPVDLYIKKTDVLAAESTSVVIDSMNVRYSPTMQVRYIDFSVREQ